MSFGYGNMISRIWSHVENTHYAPPTLITAYAGKMLDSQIYLFLRRASFPTNVLPNHINPRAGLHIPIIPISSVTLQAIRTQ